MFIKSLLIFGKVLGVIILGVLLYLFVGWPKTYSKTTGITWSVDYARYLGIDPYGALKASLDELKVKHVRIPAYWTHIEPEVGRYDWSSVDRQLDIVAARGATVTLVVGAKQPRWPECWFPEWVKTLSTQERDERQLAYVKAAVERYKARPEIVRWQVENEPSFFSSFGDCAFYDKAILPKEIELVRSLDAGRPISTTASGELAIWSKEPKGIDLGVSTYRVVSNSYFSRLTYWYLPPWLYRRRANVREWLRGGHVYVSEFQMEPWVQGDIRTLSDKDLFRTFDIEQMRKNITYAERMDMSEIQFWGVEWWYWMKTQKGHTEFWEEMKRVFHN